MKELQQRVQKVLALLKIATKGMQEPMVSVIAKDYGRDPFLILISCLLSLRAKDVVTLGISRQLFKRARTPSELVQVPRAELEKLFYPLGFYRRKAQIVQDVSQTLIDTFGGKVPGNEKALLTIKGVGRKTANLVLGEGFGIPAICVDTHVHRIANRLGWVKTTRPEDTEIELQRLVPPEQWVELNHLFVMWGQNICVPLSPWCSRCVLNPLCPKAGVKRSR